MHPVPELVDSRLYDLLEAEAGQAHDSVRRLAQFLDEGGRSPAIMVQPLEFSDKIASEIRAHLIQATLTSLPKPDIEALSQAIAAIPLAAKRFTERFGLAAGSLAANDFAPALNWIEELTEILLDTVRQLRGFESLDRVKQLYPRLQTVADRAEALIQETVNRAYERPADPLDVLKVKDLGDHLTGIVDRARVAGGLMNGISLQFL